MSVLLPNARLGVRRRVEGARDAHGDRLRAGWGPFYGPYDGRTNETTGGTWNLGLDPQLWPVRQGDLVVGATGGSWLVQSSDLIRNNYDSTVDWIRVSAVHRTTMGTEPGGGWFVARYTDHVVPPPPEPRDPHYEGGVWVGYGPPPEPSDTFQPQPGDEYVDLETGFVYVLDDGSGA